MLRQAGEEGMEALGQCAIFPHSSRWKRYCCFHSAVVKGSGRSERSFHHANTWNTRWGTLPMTSCRCVKWGIKMEHFPQHQEQVDQPGDEIARSTPLVLCIMMIKIQTSPFSFFPMAGNLFREWWSGQIGRASVDLVYWGISERIGGTNQGEVRHLRKEATQSTGSFIFLFPSHLNIRLYPLQAHLSSYTDALQRSGSRNMFSE